MVPDGRVVDRGYHDVTVVDMEEEREDLDHKCNKTCKWVKDGQPS